MTGRGFAWSERHLPAAGVLAVFSIVWSFPLALHLSTHLPGADAGDNVTFLWNFGWMRVALASDRSFFFTPLLFAPFGTDLTLHTHVALPAFAGATVLAPLPVPAALNLTVLVSLFLNAFCAYLLAWRVTRDRSASALAGIIYGGSPYLAAHLNGHFNLTTAWTLPLFAMAAVDAARGSIKSAVIAGVILGATIYIDYYYVVYEIAFALVALALTARHWSVVLGEPSERSRRFLRIVMPAVLLDVAIIVAIRLTGGIATTVGSIPMSARETFNPLQILWVLILLALWLRSRPRIVVRPSEGWQARDAAHAMLATSAGFLVLAAPILWRGAQLALRGEYVSQRYLWRSAPKGIDIATFFLGNPFHGVWGGAVTRMYEVMRIDSVENGGWLGIVPVVLAAWAIRRRWTDRAVRFWTAVGVVFLVWALGPHLMAFGRNTGLILPQAFLRVIPIVANARMPGRAMVFAYLALAILSAIALVEWKSQSRRGTALLVAAALLVVVDYLPAPFPLLAIDRPALYEALRDRPEPGVVLELPVGYRDAFVARGFLDHRVLAYQTIHGRAIAGGMVARLSPAVRAAYDADPLIDALLSLSERGRPIAGMLPDRQLAHERLRRNDIRFVVLNRTTAPAALTEYVERVLPLTLVESDGPRSLYLVAR